MLRLFTLLSLTAICASAFSQQFKPTVISNGGGKIDGSGVSMSYTFGEAITGRISNGSVLFTEGFQQSSSGITVTVTEKSIVGADIHVFPNPTQESVNISFDNPTAELVLFQLFDINGKIILEEVHSDQSIASKISLEGFTPQTYLLKISFLSGKMLGVFKIQKIK